MAESNRELMETTFAKLDSEGYEAALLPLIGPAFEFTTPAGLAAEPDTYRGEEGIRKWFESFYEVMDEIRFAPHEFHELGDWVVVPFTMTATGRSTGLEVEQKAVMSWHLREGKAVGLKLFAELDEALADLGAG